MKTDGLGVKLRIRFSITSRVGWQKDPPFETMATVGEIARMKSLEELVFDPW